MINSKPKKYVRIHDISKTVSKKFPDDLLLLSGFYSVHSIDTLLSHEATGEDVWMTIHNFRRTVWLAYFQTSIRSVDLFCSESLDFSFKLFIQKHRFIKEQNTTMLFA